MPGKIPTSPSVFGVQILTGVIAVATFGATTAVAQPPSAAETDGSRGRRAAAQYKVSATPLILTEAAPPVSRHEAERFRQTQRAYIKSPFVLHAALAQPDVASLSVFRDSTDKIGWLREHLSVTFPGDGDVMEIAVVDAKAPKEDLLMLANAVSRAYYGEVVFREQSERVLPLQILKDSLERLSRQVRDKSETLYQLERDAGLDAAAIARRQWSTDEAWLLRQRMEELQTLRFDEKLRRLLSVDERQEGSSADVAEEKWAAIDELFADEEKRLKAQLNEALATSATKAPSPNTDLDLRRQELESLKQTEKSLAHRIQLLQIEAKSPNRIQAIGSKGSASATAEFYNK